MDLQKASLNDYALPLLRIEALAKKMYDLCLERRYEEARPLAESLCVESRLLQHTLQIMEEKEQQRADPQRVQDR